MSGPQIVILLVGCFLGLQLIFYFVITGAIIKKIMGPPKRDNDSLIEYEIREKKFDKEWLKIPFRAMRRQSRFGYHLYARLYMNDTPTEKFMLLLHGHNSSSIGQLKYLELFRSLGYNVFIPDHRRSGDSGGKTITFGHYEKYDVIDWIDELQKEFPTATFAVFGESMGAATATMVAAKDKRIRFLIEYCGFASFKALAVPYLKSEKLFNFLSFGLALNALVFYKVKMQEINAFEAMQTLNIPVLIMHSKTDKVVDVSNAYAFIEANPKATVKFFEEAIHARSIITYPQDYVQTIKDFVAKAENNSQ